MNTERQIQDLWNSLKLAFRAKCEKLSTFSPTASFECEEPDGWTFYVNRNGIDGRRALEFTIDLEGFRVTYEDRWNGRPKTTIDIVISGSNVIFAIGRSAIILPEFADRLLKRITHSRAA